MNKEELKRFRENWIFNQVMHISHQQGLSKEEALSKVVIFLLDLNDEAFEEKVDEAMRHPFVINLENKQ